MTDYKSTVCPRKFVKKKKITFSIIIDETTEISTKKSVAVAVHFFYFEVGRVRDYHFDLVELEVATSEQIFFGNL